MNSTDESSARILLFLFFNQQGIDEPTSIAARIFGTSIAGCGVKSEASTISFLSEHHSWSTLWRAKGSNQTA
jgi:hypothetical protein